MFHRYQRWADHPPAHDVPAPKFGADDQIAVTVIIAWTGHRLVNLGIEYLTRCRDLFESLASECLKQLASCREHTFADLLLGRALRLDRRGGIERIERREEAFDDALGCSLDVLRLIALDAATEVVEVGCDTLEHVKMLAGFLAGFAQFAKEQFLRFIRIVREFESEFVCRRPSIGLENFDVEELCSFQRTGLTPSVSGSAAATSP
jgi:hypothetical protein